MSKFMTKSLHPKTDCEQSSVYVFTCDCYVIKIKHNKTLIYICIKKKKLDKEFKIKFSNVGNPIPLSNR